MAAQESRNADAFRRAIEHTRALSPGTFDQWFASVGFDDLTDGVLTLRVQNEFVQDWVRNSFLPVLTAKLRELTGHSIQVNWVLDSGLQQPLASGPIAEPIRTSLVVMRPD